jgi:microcystin-dependent protein
MADTYTPNFNLVLPEVGASRSTWGSKINSNTQTLDAYVAARMPPGATIDFAGSVVPNGWVVCDGRALNRLTYAALFAALGTTWGAGDGATTFNIPDLRSRVVVATGSGTDGNGEARNYALGQRLGSWSVVLNQAQLPAINVSGVGDHAHGASAGAVGDHTHTGYTSYLGDHGHYLPWVAAAAIAQGGGPGTSVSAGTGPATFGAGAHQHDIQTYGAGNHSHSISIGAAGAHTHSLGGGNAAHDNSPPVIGMNKIIFTGVVTVTTATVSATQLTQLEHRALEPVGHAD